MKKYGKKLVALLLVFTMCFSMTMSAEAAKGNNRDSGNWKQDWSTEETQSNNERRGSYGGRWGSFWDKLEDFFNGNWNNNGGSNTDTEDKNDTVTGIPELNLVEDKTTVANGDMLRAATYALAEPQAEDGTVKYFPITMFDYDQVEFNNVLRNLELAQYNGDVKSYPDKLSGLYMGNDAVKNYPYRDTIIFGGPEHGNIYYEKVTDPVNNIDPDAQYVLVSGDPNRYFAVGVNAEKQLVKVANNSNAQYLNPLSDAQVWNITRKEGGTVDTYIVVDQDKVSTWWSLLSSDGTDKNTSYFYKDTDGQYYPVTVSRSSSWGYLNRSYTYTLKANRKTVDSYSGNQNSCQSNKPSVTLYTHSQETQDADKAGYYAFSYIDAEDRNEYYLQIKGYYTPNTAETTRNIVRLEAFPDESNRLMLCPDDGMMRLHNDAKGVGSPFVTWYDVEGETNDANTFYLYKVVPGTATETVDLTKSVGYEQYNKWTNYTPGTDGKFSGNRVYQGLAKDKLDVNGQIQFNQLDAGLFTEKEFDGKKVYTNVGLPFEYDSTKQRYSFNAKEMGAWFGGAPASNVNLTYSEDPQARIGNQEDTNVAGWFPFDDSTNTPTTECKAPGLEGSEPVQAKSVGENPSYYFGMAASIDFTMTQDGKLKNGDEIDFHFSGDDDVWVFIDGKLVLDMGGIHNRINGDINFAQGTWSINQTWKSTAQAEDIKNGTANTSGDLWKTLGTDLTTFAAQETHTLSVFYLERGAGASNCELSFNLPMKDYVSVTKDATKDSEGTSLTENEQETVNKMDFTYTIYRNGEPYANQTYVILNATTGNAIGTASTNANGQFTIKNNQTARFTTAFDSTKGENWHVEESDPGAAFVNDKTKWSSTSVTINGEEKASNTGLISNTVHVVGSDEASGKINFLCENILDAKLANPGIVTADDRIVIDYGLPVQIDVKNNDLFRADTYEVLEVSGAKFGTVEITDAKNGKLKYQLTGQLTDVEEITYKVKVTSTTETHPGLPDSGTNTKTAEAEGKVYVIPATSMYYEENFKNADGKNMISYTKDQWSLKGTEDGEYQEPGVVKTTTDSPYGSDIAYLNNKQDSNGTSMYASSADANPAFRYTFTGTGTSFFARTTNESGYLKVTVKDEMGMTAPGGNRLIDTRFLNDQEKTLYNIPIYTIDDLPYGEYTVTVTVCANGTATNYGTDFWLDGIRVQNPMNPESANYNIAETAYSDDGEANVNIETLRDKLIDASGFDDNGDLVLGDGFAVMTDINGNITSAADYESIGPKQEVYLAGKEAAEGVTNGQKVSFTLLQWDMNHKLYLGLKAPMRDMGAAEIKINGHNVIVENTPDCYREISAYITVDDKGAAKIEIEAVNGVVSITNIKTTGALKFDIIPGEDIKGDEDVTPSEEESSQAIEETEAVVLDVTEPVTEEAQTEESLEVPEQDVAEPAKETETYEEETSDSPMSDAVVE